MKIKYALLIAAAILLSPSLTFAQAHPLNSGGQIVPRGAAPHATSGNGIIWVDSGASNALKYKNPAGTQFNLSLFPASISPAKGTLLSYSGSAWGGLAVGTNDYCLVADSAQTLGVKWAACAGGGGSVTSVALTAPAILSVSGSPVTTSGTLALSLATQSANTIFAGPTSGGAAAPTFRALVAADLPNGGAYATVQDEGSGVTQRAVLNFAGAGVSCADDTTKTTCTIAGGGSTGNYSFSANAMDLSGAAVMSIAPTTATGVSFGKPITIPNPGTITDAGGSSKLTLSTATGTQLEYTGGGFVFAGSTTARLSDGIYSLLLDQSGSAIFANTQIVPDADGTRTLGGVSLRFKTAAIGATGADGTCDATTRGTLRTFFAAGGAADKFRVCMKAAADTYSWIDVGTAP